jgi:hypothetical protein
MQLNSTTASRLVLLRPQLQLLVPSSPGIPSSCWPEPTRANPQARRRCPHLPASHSRTSTPPSTLPSTQGAVPGYARHSNQGFSGKGARQPVPCLACQETMENGRRHSSVVAPLSQSSALSLREHAITTPCHRLPPYSAALSRECASTALPAVIPSWLHLGRAATPAPTRNPTKRR